ncbi:MAG: hypothetical protein KKA07_06150 [Bacteroidetes bacterium]|nr:hypothetical protein [Bacteroidota bacterium]MBU1718636.1 hypothetical protein [Bacteroidota bacterium]
MRVFHLIALLVFSFLFPSFFFAGNTDSTKIVVVDSIIIKGNDRTKDHIILREITVSPDDSIPFSDLKILTRKCRLNLLNTALFNFAEIEITETLSDHVYLTVSLTERWYLWPFPLLELSDRNLNAWLDHADRARINYGFFAIQENFRGRKEELKFLFRAGYDELFGISYKIPFLNKKQTIGCTSMISFGRNHEVAVASVHNRPIYQNEIDGYAEKKLAGSYSLFWRPKIHFTQGVQFMYNGVSVSDSMLIAQPNYLGTSSRRVDYLSVLYFLKADFRDVAAYPLKGWYFDFFIVKNGLSLLENENVNFLSLKFLGRYYKPIHRNIFFAASISGKISDNQIQPYFVQQGLGYYNDFVRGYEYYVVDCQNYALYKLGLKMSLISPKSRKINWLPNERFGKIHYALYLNLFHDGAFCDQLSYQTGNPLNTGFMYGTGAGLDFVTYYDKVVRIEYSVNRQKESGLFVHFIAPI